MPGPNCRPAHAGQGGKLENQRVFAVSARALRARDSNLRGRRRYRLPADSSVADPPFRARLCGLRASICERRDILESVACVLLSAGDADVVCMLEALDRRASAMRTVFDDALFEPSEQLVAVHIFQPFAWWSRPR